MKKSWVLPNGTIVRTDCGAIDIKFPQNDGWIRLAPTLDDAEDLLVVLNRDVQRARHERGSTK